MAGSNTRDLVDRLSKPRRGKTDKKIKTPQGTITPQAGVGTFTAAASASGAGGISSPLTEISSETSRQFYESPVTMYSTDGIFSFTVNALKKVIMKDATGAQVEFVYKQYPAPSE